MSSLITSSADVTFNQFEFNNRNVIQKPDCVHDRAFCTFITRAERNDEIEETYGQQLQ